MNYPRPAPNGRDAILTAVIEAAMGMTQDWDRAFADPIAPDSLLVADLGCQSLDIVVLTADLSRQLHRRDIPFEQLFLAGGKPVADLSLRTLADFLWDQTKTAHPESISAAQGV